MSARLGRVELNIESGALDLFHPPNRVVVI
jgi:hypothetical protein